MSVTGEDSVLQAIRRAILEEPSSDLHRQAYADRCEELGDEVRAEFVRVQCRIAAIEAACLCGSCVRRRGGGRQHNGKCAVDQERDDLPDGRSRQAFLRRRERELLMPHAESWSVAGLDVERWGAATCDAKGVSLYHWEDLQHGPVADVAVTFRRGFLDEIRLTVADFEHHALSLFTAHPITGVTLTDAIIHASGGNSTYYVGGLGRFPRQYWDRLQGLPTRAATIAALSHACVGHGRHLARLPALPWPDTGG